jgi:hypothetical protein
MPLRLNPSFWYTSRLVLCFRPGRPQMSFCFQKRFDPTDEESVTLLETQMSTWSLDDRQERGVEV